MQKENGEEREQRQWRDEKTFYSIYNRNKLISKGKMQRQFCFLLTKHMWGGLQDSVACIICSTSHALTFPLPSLSRYPSLLAQTSAVCQRNSGKSQQKERGRGDAPPKPRRGTLVKYKILIVAVARLRIGPGYGQRQFVCRPVLWQLAGVAWGDKGVGGWGRLANLCKFGLWPKLLYSCAGERGRQRLLWNFN